MARDTQGAPEDAAPPSAGFGLERLGLVVLNRPGLGVALLVVLLGLAAAAMPRLSFDEDIHRVFLSQSELSQQQRAFEASLNPRTDDFAVLVEKPEGFSLEDYAVLRDLTLDLEFADGVVGVISPFLLRFSDAAPDFAGQPVFAAQLDSAVIAERLAAFRAGDFGIPTLLNDPQTAMLMLVSVDAALADNADATAAIRATVEAALPPGVTATVTGEQAISVDIVAGLKADLLTLNLLGVGLIALVSVLVLRSVRLSILAIVPAAASAWVVLGLFGWLGYPITVINNVIPLLVLVLGVADGIHMARHLDTSKGHDKHARIADTVRQIGQACALAALTTAVAFSAIMVSSNAQLFEFAVLGSVGILLAYVTGKTAFVLLALAMPLPVARTGPPNLTQRTAMLLDRHGRRHPRVVITLSLLAAIAGFYAYTQVEPRFPLYQNLPSGSEARAANDQIADQFGGVFQMWIEVETAGAQALETPEGWDRFIGLVEQLESVAGDGDVGSLVSVARWLHVPGEVPSDTALSAFPGSYTDRLQAADGDLSRVVVSIPEPMRNDAALALFDRIEDVALQNGAARVLGLPAIMRHESVSLIDQLALGLIVACLGATLMIAAAFRSAKLVPILLLPNMLPVLIAASSLHLWAGGLLNPPAVLALTIAFGIAVDDSIHFINRYMGLRRTGAPVEEALRVAVSSAGGVMIMTTVILSVGLMITLWSAFYPVRLFGGMLILTFVGAIIVDLTLLPALLRQRGARM
ncbi:MAG: MMPL family transporter [Pseudomonadota bacterium]